MSEYKQQWYLNNRERILAKQKETNKKLRAEKRRFIQNLKETTPCVDCGIQYPYYVMDFDHVRGTKAGNIGEMLNSSRSSWDALKEEIDKCDIVCANCHRQRTHNRMA